MYYSLTSEYGNTDELLKGIKNVFTRLKEISKNNDDLKLLEYHDMNKEGYVSPHDYHKAKYQYKDMLIETGTCFNSFSGRSVSCDIFAEYGIICKMLFDDTDGFIYRWEDYGNHREEIEKLLFPEACEECDKNYRKSRMGKINSDRYYDAVGSGVSGTSFFNRLYHNAHKFMRKCDKEYIKNVESIYEKCVTGMDKEMYYSAKKRIQSLNLHPISNFLVLLPLDLLIWLCCGKRKDDHMFMKVLRYGKTQITRWNKIRFRLITGYKWI